MLVMYAMPAPRLPTRIIRFRSATTPMTPSPKATSAPTPLGA